MAQEISESRFYMWRGVVAMVHADGVVTPHELSFINDYVKDMNFSQEQLEVIGEDLKNPKDTYDIFSKITESQDKIDFFALARALSWCDGDYDAQERLIIERLERVMESENQDFLRESKEILNEVELCENQWKFKTERSRKLLGFLENFKKSAA